MDPDCRLTKLIYHHNQISDNPTIIADIKQSINDFFLALSRMKTLKDLSVIECSFSRMIDNSQFVRNLSRLENLEAFDFSSCGLSLMFLDEVIEQLNNWVGGNKDDA